MKKWALVLAPILLVLSFQNCQKANLKTESSPASVKADYEKTSASGFNVLQLWDYQKGKTLDLDLNTGVMAVYANYGQVREQDLCLSEAEKTEIQNLLNQAEICEPIVPPEHYTNQVCTMVFEYPYAVLVHGPDQVRLGEKTNGCDIPVDLCGAQSQALRNFVQRVLNTTEQRACQ